MTSTNPWRRRLLSNGTALVAARTLLPGGLLTGPMSAQATNDEVLTDPDSKTCFVLIGDTPYSNSEEVGLSHVLREAAPGHDFLIHVGDIKGGTEFCTDDLLRRRLQLLDTADKPLVLVPGDNEWTDCSRFYLGNYDPLERLQFLRNIAWKRGGTLGRGKLPIESQAPLDEPPADFTRLPENLRWVAGPCLFVTINAPGSANGLTSNLSYEAIRGRVQANLDWIASSQAMATNTGVKCLVIVCHAQFLPPLYRADDGSIDALDRSRPYAWLREAFRRTVATFDGTVVCLHGDGHGYQFEYPWHADSGEQGPLGGYGVGSDLVQLRMNRFLRIRSFGTPMSTAWLSIEITRRADVVSLTATPHIS